MVAEEKTTSFERCQREESAHAVAVFSLLAQISQDLVSSLPFEQLLRAVTASTAQLLHSERCILWLQEQDQQGLTLSSDSPVQYSAEQTGNIFDQPNWARIQDLSKHSRFQERDSLITEQLQAFLRVQGQQVLWAPLMVNMDLLGLLCCVFQAPLERATSEESLLLLQIVANHTALAIRARQAEKGLLPEEVVQQFLEDLFRESSATASAQEDESLQRRARILGIDLTLPHAVALLDIMLDDSQDSGTALHIEERLARTHALFTEIKRRLERVFPGSLAAFSKETFTATCFIALSEAAPPLHLWLRDLYLDLLQEQQARVFVGLSNVYQSRQSYPLEYQEAMHALAYGKKTNPVGGVAHIKDLEVFQYLNHHSADEQNLTNFYLNAIKLIVAYDQKKDTDLLATLEAWLLSGGKTRKTVERLKQMGIAIHHNTVEQRIARINEELRVSRINVEDPELWADLINAIRVYKLQQV